jgi:hypothetical protein
VQATTGEVLAVPLAALFATADGGARLEIETSPAEPTRLVAVKTGLAADGYVEVSALDGELAEGDRVVIGEQRNRATGGDETGSESETTAPDGDAEEALAPWGGFGVGITR